MICLQCSVDFQPKWKWQVLESRFCDRNCESNFKFKENPPNFFNTGKQTFAAEQRRYKRG